MNGKSSSSSPPSEQSGYFILDVRELDSFIAGPWLEIIPLLNSSSNNKQEQDQDQQEDDDSNNKISKAAASSSSTALSKLKNNKMRRAKLCYIPMSELKSRLFELPAKRSNLILVYDSDQDSDYIQQQILGDGWTVVDEFRMVGARNTETITSSHRQSYIESASWLVSPEVFHNDKKKMSSSSLINNNNIKFPLFHNTPFTMDEIRGWSPSPFLETHFDSVIYPSLLHSSTSLKGSTISSNNNNKSTGHSSSSPFYSALDIGSGNGRDIAYIASRGIFDTIFAIDNRHHLLENCVSLTKRYSISTRSRSGNNQHISASASASSSSSPMKVTTCHGICCSVSSSLPLREESFDLIICVRFLERSLLTSLARHLTVGGFLLYSHFVDGVQHSAVGQPKNPKAYVMHGELKKKIVDEAILPSSLSAIIVRVREDDEDDDNDISNSSTSSTSWKIKVLVDEEVLLEDGRPVNNLLIQRIG